MSRVFSEASRVLIWLGHDDSTTPRIALSFIYRFLDPEWSSHPTAKCYWNSEALTIKNDEAITFQAPPDDVEISALEDLFTRPYFRRGWIVQEIVLSKAAQVFWGRARIDYLCLEKFAAKMTSGFVKYLSDDAQHGIVAMRHIRKLRFPRRDIPGQYTFTTLLKRTNRNVFSDPRDCIYGLLGMQRIYHDMPIFEIDYTISKLHCFESAVMTLLVDCGDIGILSLIKHQDVIPENWPSWVARLDHRLEQSLSRNYYCWRASGHLEATISRDAFGPDDMLRIRGICVSKVAWALPKILQRPEGVRGSYEIQEELRTLDSWYGERCVAWTMACGSKMGSRSLSLNSREELQHIRIDEYRALIGLDPTDYDSHGIDPGYFGRRCSWTMRNATLFGTEEDQLGIGQGPIQVGDQVVVFFGGRMPFVLRPVGTRWRLVGVCFVHGIMEGELVEQMEHDPRYMAEDFDVF